MATAVGPLGLATGEQAAPDLGALEYLLPSDDFSVRVNGQPVFVYKSLKTGEHGSHDITSMSFAGFDLSGPAEVEVTPRQPVRTFAIRPYQSGIEARRVQNTLRFTLNRPQQVVVQINDSYDPVLVLAADPSHTPPEPSQVTHYFGPGVHEIGDHMSLRSGARVYLARHAIVQGSFALQGVNDVQITGRGILYNGHLPHRESFRVIAGDATRNVLIEGITICHSPGWIISFWSGSRDLTVRNVKMVGNWFMNTDGVQTGSKGLLVEHCFLECNDDNFSLNGVCRQVEIRHNLLWNLYNGGVFMLGWATGPRFELEDVDIHDNVILRAGGCCDYDRKAPFSMKVFGAHRRARNIRFHNIVIEDIAPYGRWIDLQAGQVRESQLADFRFENIEVLRTWKVEGEIRGSPDSPIREVEFRNVRIAGRPMLSPADGGLNLVHTEGVRINGRVWADTNAAPLDLKRAANAPANPSAPAPSLVPHAKTPPATGANLLVNPEFEDGLRGWSLTQPNHGRAESVARTGGHAIRVFDRKRGDAGLQQDVTKALLRSGPGLYTYGARVQGTDSAVRLKVTLELETTQGVQKHPSADVLAIPKAWTNAVRRQTLHWAGLKRALLIIESSSGDTGGFYADAAWLVRADD